MKASEMIKRLEAHKEYYGDVEVRITVGHGSVEVDAIRFVDFDGKSEDFIEISSEL